MTEDDVILAACEHLLLLSPRPSIVWENVKFDGSDDALLVVESIPSRPEARSLGGTHEFSGIFQVSVLVPRNSGTGDALQIARDVQHHFYGAQLSFAKVIHFPFRKTGYDDGVNYRMPVQVRYQGFSQPAI